jgi:hypothetical protein
MRKAEVKLVNQPPLFSCPECRREIGVMNPEMRCRERLPYLKVSPQQVLKQMISPDSNTSRNETALTGQRWCPIV